MNASVQQHVASDIAHMYADILEDIGDRMVIRVISALIALSLTISISKATNEQYTLDDIAKAATSQLRSNDTVVSVKREAEDTLIVSFSDGEEVSFFLGNLYVTANDSTENVDEITARYVSVILNSVGVEEERAPDQIRKNLFPIVRHIDYANAIKTFVKDAADRHEYFVKPLKADYRILIALDTDESISVPSLKDLQILRMSETELLSLAVDNFRRKYSEKISVEHGNGVHMVLLDGNYEASVLLLDEYWEEESGRLRDKIIAVAPARDVLLYAQESNTNAVSQIIQLAEENISTLSNAISDRPLIWNDGLWSAYNP